MSLGNFRFRRDCPEELAINPSCRKCRACGSGEPGCWEITEFHCFELLLNCIFKYSIEIITLSNARLCTSISLIAACNLVSDRPVINTLAPLALSCLAVSFPIPKLPPVTIMFLSFKFIINFFSNVEDCLIINQLITPYQVVQILC